MRFFKQRRRVLLSVGLAVAGALLLFGCAEEDGLTGGSGTPGVPTGTSWAYPTVEINGKIWMAKNLNEPSGSGASWCYENDPDNCYKYGRLYDWNAAKTICPAGWRLPLRKEWEGLVDAKGGSLRAGRNLRDTLGFGAMPGGYRYVGGSFALVGNYGYWWTATEFDDESAYHRGMGNVGDTVGEYFYIKEGAFSVRCIKNSGDGQASSGGGEGKNGDPLALLNNGQPYDTVIINRKAWMTENFNYATSAGSWCYGDNNSNCGKYGRLYDWNTARAVCPVKWRLPSISDWRSLFDSVGSDRAAGRTLKSETGWRSGTGTNEYGFSALPGGSRYVSGRYGDVNNIGNWWTDAEYDEDNATYVKMQYNSDGADYDVDEKEERGFSVRCVRDVRYVTVSAGEGAVGSNYYFIDVPVTILAGTPPSEQRFVRWVSVPIVEIDNPDSTRATFTMPNSNVTVTAEFEQIPKVKDPDETGE